MDLPAQGNERQSYTNIQGHPQSTKHSRTDLNGKLLTVGGISPMALTKTACTTTNSSTAQETKSFNFNSSLGNKNSSRNPGAGAGSDERQHNGGIIQQVKREVQAAASAVCQYYMAGLEKYLKHGIQDSEYFAKIYKEHFLQGFQAINFCKFLKAPDPSELAKKKVYLAKKDCYKGMNYSNFTSNRTFR